MEESALTVVVREETVGVDASVVVVREPGRTALWLSLREPLDIGRECDGLILLDGQLSRRHLRLAPRNGQVLVTDLGSTNGTSIDGRRLDSPVVLRPGMVVTAGETTIELAVDLRATRITGTRSLDPLRQTSIDLVAAVVDAERPVIAPSDLGTVTIVFTDIERSTERAVELGDVRWYEVLETHNRIVLRNVASHGGQVVKSQGDGFMMSFPSARAAVLALSAVQRDLEAHAAEHPADQVRIRVGLHTGEVIVDDVTAEHVAHVVLAARIANEATGGEILVSSLVREIIETRGDVTFGEPRTVELKGIGGRHTVHPIQWV